MEYKPEITEKIRNLSVARMVGYLERGRRIDGPCPICSGGNNTPCFSIYPDNSFHCFKCEAHGFNFIDFLKAKGYDFKQIYAEFQDDV